MSPELLLTVGVVNKRWMAMIIGTVVIILSMPVIVVIALGQGALDYLSDTPSSSDNTTSISTTTIGLYEGPTIAGDTYAWGNCTYWVYALRLEAGDPIPTSWGNAATWSSRALAGGYTVDHTPLAGAIMQTADSAGGLGHVAYVTAVNSFTGNWTISEMNVKGLDIIDIRTLSVTEANSYWFIHDKV